MADINYEPPRVDSIPDQALLAFVKEQDEQILIYKKKMEELQYSLTNMDEKLIMQKNSHLKELA